MNTKTLMTMAVAGTFGLSAAAFAGSGHEVITPFSVKDAGENFVSNEKGFSESYTQSAMSSSAVGSTTGEGGWMSGAYDSSAIQSESTASLATDENYALANDGSYSDFYVVSWAPVMQESWDLYVLNTGDMNELAAADQFEIGVPSHELALIDSGDGILEVALVPTAEATNDSQMLGD